MATAVASKPAAPHQKMKRPPAPAAQTNPNGVKLSQSPSPSLAHKRLPSTLKQSPSATVVGANGTTNGAARLSSRRRDSQKPGDPQSRPNRSGKNTGDSNFDKRKRLAEPYVKMNASHILKKYRGKQPSLIVHLHPTHFRFDQQDGSFSYTSPMRKFLQHLRSETVPHDMIEELNAAGVKFYEAADSKTSSKTTNEKNVPFSVHNYNEHLTPSPCVPYPKLATANGSASKAGNTMADTSKTDTEPSQGNATSQKAPDKGPRIFTTVLFPTQQSVEEELYILANTPDPRSNSRKQSQASAANRTPASATMPHPPTPLSAVPPTPITGPSNKKQKMLLGESDMRDLQCKLTTASAPPLFLEPVASLVEASKLIQCLTDLQHKENLPPPKTRKRTVAELEADEAQAASEQRFMLIMDERLANSGAATSAGGGDGEAGAAAFEPRFERFKTIESIKAAHREKEQQMQEAKAVQQQQIQAANKVKQEQVEQQKLFMEKKNAETAQREQQIRTMQNAQNAQQQKASLAALQHQQQLAANQNLHGHGPTANGIMSNQPNIPANSQPQHSSPITRNITPHSNPRSSPLVGNVPHSIPMNVTTSGQGVTSSPARPTSAAQHGHPAGGVAMVARGSQQRPPSRMGTPSMPNGTPSMQHGTPVIKQGTPTPRVNQGSPPNGRQQTPMMNATGFAAQHINGQPITPEMQDRYRRERAHQMQIQQQQIHAQQQHNLMNNMSPNHGMSPMHMPPQTPNLQHLAAQNQGMSQQNIRAYQAYQQEHHRQMNAGGMPNQMITSATPNPHGRPMPPQPPHPAVGGAPLTPQQLRAQQQQQHAARMQMQFTNQAYSSMMEKLIQQYGSREAVPHEASQQARQKATFMAKNAMMQKQQQMNQMRQAQAQQQQMMAAQMAGGMGGMGGMNGMPGMGGMQ
ncbi:MAG: hypothetical protein Q9166_004788 [cf. Caloplaca sp. 2 TL-2023]